MPLIAAVMTFVVVPVIVSVPVPPVSSTSGVVPSPNEKATSVAVTVVVVPLCSKENEPLTVCPATESRAFVAATRRNWPAGRSSLTEPSPTSMVSAIGAVVRFSASVNVPARSTPAGSTPPRFTVPVTCAARPLLVTSSAPSIPLSTPVSDGERSRWPPEIARTVRGWPSELVVCSSTNEPPITTVPIVSVIGLPSMRR